MAPAIVLFDNFCIPIHASSELDFVMQETLLLHRDCSSLNLLDSFITLMSF